MEIRASEPPDMPYGKYRVRHALELLNNAIETKTIWAVIVLPFKIKTTKHKNMIIFEETKNRAILTPLKRDVILILATSRRRAISTSLAKGFSQVYIFMTLIDGIISFISLILSSVSIAVFPLSLEKRLPIYIWKGRYTTRTEQPTKTDHSKKKYKYIIDIIVCRGPANMNGMKISELSNLLTSFDIRLTICPTVVLPNALWLSRRDFL